METFETSFVRIGANIQLEKNSKQSDAIKITILADCFLDSHTLDPSEQFIEPGIIIRQEAGQYTGYATDKTILFTYKAKHILQNIVIENNKLFAYDTQKTVYIYSPNIPEAEKYTLSQQPIGWKPVPQTTSFVYWTQLSLHVYNTKNSKDKMLIGHNSRITALDTSVSTTVSGDSMGNICIWYNSSCLCHHHISTGPDRIQSIIIQHNSVFVLSGTTLKEYNLQTGALGGIKTVIATSMIKLNEYLLLSSESHLALFLNTECITSIKCRHYGLISADEGTRFFLLTNKGVLECEWPNVEWPTEFLDWIQAPEFPFQKQWPKITSIDILATTADIWIPRTRYLDLPKQWFRHEPLREAIWDTVIANDIDISYNWLFLTPSLLHKWYQKNVTAMLNIIESNDYNHSAPIILNRIYQHISIESPRIQQWCWLHHKEPTLKHINVYIIQQGSIWAHIATQPVTQTAAIILTTQAVRTGLKNGYVAIFIRMLCKYHEFLPCGPTHHMKQMWNMIITHIYHSLKSDTMSLPLKESGSWLPLDKPRFCHLGAFIQQHNIKGYISKIEFQPELQILWKPRHSDTEMHLSVDEPVHIWTYYHNDGPNTMLECALTILSKEIWQTSVRKKTFKWPKTEIGAKECENISIRVFDEPMRIVSIKWAPGKSQIKTSTGLIIDQHEIVHIESVTPLWSYYEDQLYHIIPIKLKLCSELVQTQHNNSKVSVKYAKELISALQYKVIDKEHQHQIPQTVTAVSKSIDTFFVGLITGEILEYESVANFIPIRHFVKHTEPIKSISTFKTRLLTICKEEMNIWNLHSGHLLFGKQTNMYYIDSIQCDQSTAWVIEKDNEHALIQLWDVFDEHILKTEHLVTSNEIFTTNTPAIVTSQKVISLKNDRQEYKLGPLQGHITCVTETYNGICGGTTDGVVFMVDESTGEIQQWESTTFTGISAVTAMDDQPYVITGTDHGEIMIWNIDSKKTNIISITKFTSARIDHIFFDNIFAAVIQRHNINLVSVVLDRCALTTNAIKKCMSWSETWKRRIIKEASSLLLPCVETCILQNIGVQAAMDLLLDSTDEYKDRMKWCSQDFIDILLEVDPKMNKLVIKRLASFSGPKVECAICNDEHNMDRICYLKPCQHRFHTGCIAQLIQTLPEYHHEMQQEYALHVTLKCPMCREPFVDTDVCDDRFINQFFSGT